MKERPILFSAPMVRAILDGRKTVTRRAVKFNAAGRVSYSGKQWHPDDPDVTKACPYGQPGDRLWVRETCALRSYGGAVTDTIHYAATPEHGRFLQRDMRTFSDSAVPTLEGRWRPSIHMPRWASRITLEVTGVRVERLWDITPEQAIAEGIEGARPSNLCEMAWRDYTMAKHDPFEGFGRPVDSFHSLWVSINGIESWHANPWVWVVEFKRVTP